MDVQLPTDRKYHIYSYEPIVNSTQVRLSCCVAPSAATFIAEEPLTNPELINSH